MPNPLIGRMKASQAHLGILDPVGAISGTSAATMVTSPQIKPPFNQKGLTLEVIVGGIASNANAASKNLVIKILIGGATHTVTMAFDAAASGDEWFVHLFLVLETISKTAGKIEVAGLSMHDDASAVVNNPESAELTSVNTVSPFQAVVTGEGSHADVTATCRIAMVRTVHPNSPTDDAVA